MAQPNGFRGAYDEHGVAGFYQEHGAQYRNPHEPALARALPRCLTSWRSQGLLLNSVLDLACGSGEVTLVLRGLPDGAAMKIDACDPFTWEAFERRTGLPCARTSFEDVEQGALEGREYDAVICCFAMHLVDDSRLVALGTALALAATHLIIITPHKRPDLTPDMGWTLRQEAVVDRIRMRWYVSQYRPPA
jgi:hypothetical protein